MSNIYYWEKLTFSKLVVKVNLSERKFEEMHFMSKKSKKALNCKMVQGIFGETLILALLSSTVFRLP